MICLQNICLGLIAEKFERFHFAFSVSKVESLKRSFEFLQKKYSSELLSELYQRSKLKDEYLEFLLNEHLKFLAEKWVYKSHSHQYCKKYVFSRLPNLKKIYCFDINDEILKNIAKFCPKIVEIDGTSSRVTNQGVNYLCKKKNGSVPCPELKILCIRKSEVTIKGLKNLIRNIKSLEKLDHKNVPLALYSIHKRKLPKLEKVPSYNLVELKLFDESEDPNLLPYNNDLLKICLTVCPKLKSLACAISDKEELSFFNNTCLEELSIFFKNSKQTINIDNFLNNCGRNLIRFIVVNCIMSVSKLSVSCPKLELLILDDVIFSDDHSDSKIVFHCLMSFNFCRHENQKVNDRAISLLLLSSPSLEEIRFFYCDLSPTMKIYILKCCEKYLLKSICFMECDNVEKNFVKDVLLSCPSLKSLETRFFPHLVFSEQEELIQFAETLPNKPRIEIFDLQ